MKKRPMDEVTESALARLVDVVDLESKKMLKSVKDNPDKIVHEATRYLPELLRALIALQKFNIQEEEESIDPNASDEQLIEQFIEKRGWKIVKGDE